MASGSIKGLHDKAFLSTGGRETPDENQMERPAFGPHRGSGNNFLIGNFFHRILLK
jgi:hypothetical protein